ncbi:MAG: PAS domain S-box protein, partial [Geitlerinemataceae cyanobacterium]
ILAIAFMPHGTCYLWKPGLVGLHLLSNLIIAISYFSIPLVLVRIVGKRDDIPFDRVFSLFAAFIVFCGIGHLMDIWTLWHPNYWLSGSIRALTALVSLGTAIVLVVLFPQIAKLPSPRQIEEKNRELEREIQERQRIETELRKERQFLQALLANLSDGIVACDAEGVLTLFNRATQEFHGLPMEAIAAEDWGQYYDLFHADGKTPLPREEIPLFRALQGESVRGVEMSIVPKDGEIRYILANGDPILTPEGEKLGAVVAMRDISDRKQSETRLQDSERLFRAIFNSMYQFIGLLQPDGIVLEVNQTALDFAGISAEDVLGRPFWETPWCSGSQEIQVRLKNEIERAAGGEFIRYEAEIRGAMGTTATIDFSLKPVFDDAGKVVLLIPEGRDITEIKQAEAALKASEERWQLILVGTGDGIFDWNISTGDAFLSPVFKALLGYENDQIENTYDGWAGLVHPEDLDRTLAAVRSHLNGKTPQYTAEYRMRCKDGSYKWILARGIARRDKMGNPVQMVGSFQDISDRKTAETALRDSLARYRLLAENSSDLIATQTLDGIYLYVSPTCQALLGYPATALTGRSIFEFLHPEDADALQRLRSITGQFPSQFVQSYRMRRSDGTYIWLETTYQLSNHLEDRSTRLIVSISRDITDRKQAEIAIVTLNQELERELIDRRSKLKAVNRLYRAAINSVQEVIFQTDKTGRWTFLSPAWEEITGFSIEESLNAYFFDFIYPRRDQQRIDILFQDLIDGRREFIRYEFRTPTQNSSFRWLEMFAQIDADDDDTILGIYGTLNDVTDRKQAETLLKSRADELLKQQRQIELQNLQLQEAARIKSQFLATMSHELRTPLNAIMGVSQLLQTQMQGKLTQRQEDMVDRIFNNSRNLLEMLNEILDFSRLEVGSVEINPTSFEVGLFARLVTEELRSLAEKKNLTLNVNVTIGNSQIISDRNALRRVLVNLIANAIKFTETGSVTVEVNDVGTERVAITVTDTGIGIKPENVAQIFEAFHQVDRTLTRKYEGTGLGLAITKTLVDLMEGEISVESQVDRGSTFRVEIPRQLASADSIYKQQPITDE